MPITDLLRRNAREFGEDTALVEINPEHAQKRRVTWKEYELIEPANAATGGRLPGGSLTSTPTALPICCSAGGLARAKRWPSC